MFKQIQLLIACTAFVAAMSLPLLPHATAQIRESDQTSQPEISIEPTTSGNAPLLAQRSSQTSSQAGLQGRGVAQGSAFTRGRTATVALTIDGSNFGLELAEPPGTRARVQYRGSIVRQNNSSSNSNSFTLDGRVQSFNSTENLRVRGTTTGTCRIEVFDSRVISSLCNTISDDSRTQFLGLEQF